MSHLAAKLRDMRASAGDRCDPEFNKALLDAAREIERLHREVADLRFTLGHSSLTKDSKP